MPNSGTNRGKLGCQLLEVFQLKITALVESGEHPPTNMADYMSRALRAEYRVNQYKEEWAKFYEARKAQKGQEIAKTKNDKFSPKGGQESQGRGNKREGNSFKQKNS